jgi:outer membrane lipoprotein-sorting protein
MSLTIAAIVVWQAVALVPGRPIAPQAPSPEAILERVDRNAVAGTKIIVSEMVIRGRRDSRTVKAKSWIEGADKAFTEYLDPPREKGTKMLKLEDQLWAYSPSTDRTISISGHMLRQSVMGSDLSYEDMMEDHKLLALYDAKVVAEDTLLDRPCWVLELTAKADDASYFSRKVWVDKDRYVLLREDRFAKSGKLLKTLEVKSVIRAQNRWVQDDLVFRDVLKQGDGTTFRIVSVEFDTDIPAAVFSKASLRK